jgi:signal transduction histidine kinase
MLQYETVGSPVASLQRKIQLGYYAFAVAMAGVALLAYSNLTYLEHNIAPDLAAAGLLNTVLEIRRYEKNYFLYGGDGALAEVSAYVARAEALIAEARPRLTGLGAGAGLDRLQEELVRYRRALDAYHGGAGTSQAGTEAAAIVLRRAGHDLVEHAEAIAHAQHARLLVAVGQSRSALLGVGALVIVLSVLAAQWLARRTTRPLGMLADMLEGIARGRYDQVTPVSRDREILAVSTAVNRMLVELESRRRHLVQAEKLSSLGTLVSGVAHELNNPLSNVSTSCQILAEELDTASPVELRGWIGQIDAETERARGIVRTLLDFSREGSFRKRRLALRSLVDQTLLLVARFARDARVEVDVPDGLSVDADPQRLQQVLVNLIRNAVDAGGPGVRVRLQARAIAAESFQMPEHSVCGRSETPAAPGNQLVLIRVEDDGPGIPPEVLPRVFDPFFTTKDVGHGSGLGLFVSQEIVHQHGGCIGVRSRPGEGSQFLIGLPSTPLEGHP